VAAGEGAVTSVHVRLDGFSRVFIAPNAFVGCSPNHHLLERFPLEMGTDGRYAFDLGKINAAPMSWSSE